MNRQTFFLPSEIISVRGVNIARGRKLQTRCKLGRGNVARNQRPTKSARIYPIILYLYCVRKHT